MTDGTSTVSAFAPASTWKAWPPKVSGPRPARGAGMNCPTGSSRTTSLIISHRESVRFSPSGWKRLGCGSGGNATVRPGGSSTSGLSSNRPAKRSRRSPPKSHPAGSWETTAGGTRRPESSIQSAPSARKRLPRQQRRGAGHPIGVATGHPIGVAIGVPMGHPSRVRIPRPDPTRPDQRFFQNLYLKTLLRRGAPKRRDEAGRSRPKTTRTKQPEHRQPKTSSPRSSTAPGNATAQLPTT